MAVQTDKIRNLCFLGHGGSGKTSIAEAMLYLTGNTDRLGTSTLDYDPEEAKRGFSISLSCANLLWKDTKINLLDTPGTLDFAGEVSTALRVAGAAVITVDAKSGVQVGTELAWERASAAGIPKTIFVNKSDDPEMKYGAVLDSLIATFGNTVCPVIIPMGGGAFANLIELKKYTYDAKGNRSEEPIEATGDVAKYRDSLFEAVASTDEALMEKFFEGEEITGEEASAALNKGIREGSITPVYFGAATKLWGIKFLLDSIAECFPNPADRKEIDPAGEPSVFVYKTSVDQFGRTSYFKVMSGTLQNTLTLQNAAGGSEKFAHFYTVVGKKQTEVTELSCGDMGAITKLASTSTGDTLSVSGKKEYDRTVYPEPFYTMAISPKNKGEEDKIAQGITKILDEDKTVRFENNAETKQMLLSTMGNMHLDVVLARMKGRGCPDANLSEPRIAYRETIRGKAAVEGKHKKQSGGHGQYGHVKITFSPGSEDGLTFTTSVVGGSVPKNYFPAVEKGLQEAMQKGVLAGYPVVGLAADLFDGSYHDVDSNELSFKMAASLAYKAGLPQAKPVLLEPVGELKVTIPDSMVGAVMGDINSKRRGMVLGSAPTEGKTGYTTIDAEVPKAEMSSYTIDLRAMTQGKGSYTFYFIRYDEVPNNIAQKIIADAKARADEE